jgi:pimeloyl-ACP methyl ester carboxylesterase
MKNRAGVVGQRGVNPLLGRVKKAYPNIKLHLVGHSFGGRLVTATALGDAAAPVKFETMALLQAAFSHFGFADNYEGTKDGFFRDVVTGSRIRGPVIITHTENDRAVGLAYPIASRIMRQVAAAIGDANDPYGGIGRNGAQKTPEVETLTMLGVGEAYAFKPGRLHNLRADQFISNHGDVRNPEVAHALLSAVAVT